MLPNINFEVSGLQPSELSRLSQPLEDQSLVQSNVDTVSLEGNDNSKSSIAGSITPNTPLSHRTEQEVFKKSKEKITTLEETSLTLPSSPF